MKLGIDQIRQMVLASFEGADLSIEGIRVSADARAAQSPMPEGVTVEPLSDDAGIEAEWLRPAQIEPGRTLLYFHGGGYLFGSLVYARSLVARIAVAARAPALSVAYRRAPENPFPAALDDAVAAYRWLTAKDGGGVDPSTLAVVGTSAGGGLALALALRVRDHEDDLELPAALGGLSPWVDLCCDHDSLHSANDPLCQKDPVLMMAAAYLAGHDAKDPLASPLHGELAGLPPVLLHVGGAEGLRDESEAFANKAKAAGVDVTLDVYPDMIHSWHAFAPVLDDAEQAIVKLGEFVRTKIPGR